MLKTFTPKICILDKNMVLIILVENFWKLTLTFVSYQKILFWILKNLFLQITKVLIIKYKCLYDLLCLKPPKNRRSMFKCVLITFINYFDSNDLVKNKSDGSCKVKKLLKYWKKGLTQKQYTIIGVHSGFDFFYNKSGNHIFSGWILK